MASNIEGIVDGPPGINTGYVQYITAGNGIDITGPSHAPTISVEQSIIDDATNAVKSVNPGTNINITGPATDPIVSTTGVVTSVNAGTNTTVTGTATDPIVNVTGVVTSVNPGTNTTITGTSSAPIVNVSGVVTSVNPGTNTTITGTSSAPIVNVTGVVTSVNAGTNTTVTGTSSAPIVNVSGVVTSVNAGTQISITGTATAPIVNFVPLGVGANFCYLKAGNIVIVGVDGPITGWTTTIAGIIPSSDGSPTLGGFDTAAGVWTVPITGVYHITIQVTTTYVGGLVGEIFLLNATTTDRLPIVLNTLTGTNRIGLVSRDCFVTAGDLLSVRFNNPGVYTQTEQQTYWNVIRVE